MALTLRNAVAKPEQGRRQGRRPGSRPSAAALGGSPGGADAGGVGCGAAHSGPSRKSGRVATPETVVVLVVVTVVPSGWVTTVVVVDMLACAQLVRVLGVVQCENRRVVARTRRHNTMQKRDVSKVEMAAGGPGGAGYSSLGSPALLQGPMGTPTPPMGGYPR